MEMLVCENIASEIEIPPEGILSKPLLRDEHLKVVLFGFSPGQELSEHTAAVPAIMHILDGEGEVTLGGQTYAVKSGAWFYMPGHTPHSVRAISPLKMVLSLLA